MTTEATAAWPAPVRWIARLQRHCSAVLHWGIASGTGTGTVRNLAWSNFSGRVLSSRSGCVETNSVDGQDYRPHPIESWPGAVRRRYESRVLGDADDASGPENRRMWNADYPGTEFARKQTDPVERRARETDRRDILPHLETERALVSALSAGLTTVGLGVLLVDDIVRVRFASSIARAVLDEGDCLCISNNRLTARDAAENAALRTHMDELLSARVASGSQLRITRESGLAAVTLHMRSVARGTFRGVVVAVDRPEGAKISPRALRELFDFTRCEAALAILILNGATLKDAAVELDVSLEGLRTRLKGIMRKTNTHRQSDLVRVMLGGSSTPAGMRPTTAHGRG